MIDADKKNFWNMMNVCSELYKRPALSKDAIIIWYEKLVKFDFHVISNALDKWTNEHSTMPTPHDIIELCKPSSQPDFTHKLVNKISDDKRKENREKLHNECAKLGIKLSVAHRD